MAAWPIGVASDLLPAVAQRRRRSGTVTVIGSSRGSHLSMSMICSVDSGGSPKRGVDLGEVGVERVAPCQRGRPHQALVVREGELIHHPRGDRWCPGPCASEVLQDLGLLEVGEHPRQHRHRCIALEQGCAGKAAVVLALGIGLERVDPVGRVLQRVRVLMRVGHPGLDVESGIGHDHHPLSTSS